MAVDALGHVLARGHQLARAAGRAGKRAHERLGDRVADADGKDAVAGPARLGDYAVGIPHFAVGDQQQIAGHAGFAGAAVGGAQRVSDLRAAHVGVQAAHEAARLGDVGRGRRRFAAKQRAVLAAERHDVEQVAGPQAVEYPLAGGPHLRDRIAAHRSRAIDHDLDVAVRGGLGPAVQLRAEAGQSDPFFAVAGEQRPAAGSVRGARLRGGGFQYDVAVHRRRPLDLDYRPVRLRRDGDGVRR